MEVLTEHAAERQAYLHDVAVFSSIVLLTMSAAFLIARAGYRTDYLALGRVAGIGLLFVNIPSFGGTRWFSHGSFLWLCAVASLALAGSSPKLPAGAIGWCVAAAGWPLFIWNFVRWLKCRKKAPVLTASLWLGIFCSTVYWGSGYANPLFDHTVLTGEAHIDTLFHTSMANMIRTYGIPSTGLNGVPFVHYHFASHWLAASLATVAGISVWSFYNFAFGIIFIPLMVSSLLTFVFCLSHRNGCAQAGGLFWATALVGLIGILPMPLSWDIGLIQPGLPWTSESYVLAVALSFTSLETALLLYRELPDENKRLTVLQGVALTLVLPVLLAICGLTKASILFLLFSMALYACIRLDLWKRPVFLCAVAISSILAHEIRQVVIMSHVSPMTFSRRLELALDYGWQWPYFLLFNFFWLWVLFAVTFKPLSTRKDFVEAWRARRVFSLELLLVCSIVSLVPGVVLDLTVDACYFWHYQNLLGLALVLGHVLTMSQEPMWPSPAVIFFGFLMVWNLASSTLYFGRIMAQSNIRIRAAVSGAKVGSRRNDLMLLAASMAGKLPANALSTTPGAQLLENLRQLEALPLEEKRRTVLYLPKTNRAYWTLPVQRAAQRPFIAPALTGIAMVGGIPDDSILESSINSINDDYGYIFYSRPSFSASSGNADGAVDAAFAMGFRRVVIIDQFPDGGCCAISSRTR